MKNIYESKKAATSIEYALIASLLSIVILVSVSLVGDRVNDTFISVGSKVNSAHE